MDRVSTQNPSREVFGVDICPIDTQIEFVTKHERRVKLHYAFIYFIIKRTKFSYEVHLFVQNEDGEMLFVFDQRLGRFVVPYRQVAFDEIPTKVIYTMMTDLVGTSH